MAYTLSERAPGASNLTAKNRVWGFFENSNRTRPANRRQPLETRRKICLTPTKTASGIPYWPSRDPIGEGFETGEINLYGFVGNDGTNYIDISGFKKYKQGSHNANEKNKQANNKIKKDHQDMLDKKTPADHIEDALDTIDTVLDLVEDPLGSVGEAVARRSAKAQCEKAFIASGYEKGCACCEFSLKKFTLLQGGAEAVEQWQTWGVTIRNKNCNAYLKELSDLALQREEYNRKHKLTPLPKLVYTPQDNEATATIITEYENY